MTHRTSGMATRTVTRALSLLALGAMVAFVLHVNTGIAVDVSAASTPEGRLPVGISIQVERRADVAAVRDARELPMRAEIRSAAVLTAWARTEGRDGLMQAAALNPWEQVMLGRFIAIHNLVLDTSERFGNDALWMFQILASESALDPLAQGPEDGDRGLGQVSFASEYQAALWAADPSSPYDVPDFDPARTVWHPQKNLTLAAIVLRSLYAMPDVTTHAEAYARYTHGLDAVIDGRIAERTVHRVERAEGYEEQLRFFLVLAHIPFDQITSDADAPVLRAEMVRDMLLIGQVVDPGMPRYLALRDLYLAQKDSHGPSLWGLVLQMREALNYTRLAEQVAGIDGHQYVVEIHEAIQARMGEIEATGDELLITAAQATLADAATGADTSVATRTSSGSTEVRAEEVVIEADGEAMGR
jgi:hypothetical protein